MDSFSSDEIRVRGSEQQIPEIFRIDSIHVCWITFVSFSSDARNHSKFHVFTQVISCFLLPLLFSLCLLAAILFNCSHPLIRFVIWFWVFCASSVISLFGRLNLHIIDRGLHSSIGSRRTYLSCKRNQSTQTFSTFYCMKERLVFRGDGINTDSAIRTDKKRADERRQQRVKKRELLFGRDMTMTMDKWHIWIVAFIYNHNFHRLSHFE